MTPDERKQVLAQTIANTLARSGRWRVESQSDYNTIVVKGSRPQSHPASHPFYRHVRHIPRTSMTRCGCYRRTSAAPWER